jgi:hypothetical protein
MAVEPQQIHESFGRRHRRVVRWAKPLCAVILALAVAIVAYVFATGRSFKGATSAPRAADTYVPERSAALHTKVAFVRLEDITDPFPKNVEDRIPADSGISLQLRSEFTVQHGSVEVRYARADYQSGTLGIHSEARLLRWALQFPLENGEYYIIEPVFESFTTEEGEHLRREIGVSTLIAIEPPMLTEEDVVRTTVVPGNVATKTEVAVQIKLSAAARERVATMSAAWVHKRIAILMGGRAYTVARLEGAITGEFIAISVSPGSPARQAAEADTIARAIGHYR